MFCQTNDGLASSSFDQLYKTTNKYKRCGGVDGEPTLQEQRKECDGKDQKNGYDATFDPVKNGG